MLGGRCIPEITFQVVQLRAVGGVRSRAGYNSRVELFGYLENILGVQHVENMEKKDSFLSKMSRDKANTSTPTSRPESWEEFKQTLPKELKETLGGEDFCDISDMEDAAKEGLVVFASADGKERLTKSPNWLLNGGELGTFSVNFFKQVRI